MCQSLVTLQIHVTGEKRIIVGEASVHVSVSQCGVRIDILIGMPFPVSIQGNHICLIEFPFSTYRHRCVIVLHIIGLDIHTGMLATGAIDTLPIDTAIGIELNLGSQLVSEMLCYLPVSMTVDGLVP